MSRWLDMLARQETRDSSTPKTGKRASRGFPGSTITGIDDIPGRIEKACYAVKSELDLTPDPQQVTKLLLQWIDDNAGDFAYTVGTTELRKKGSIPPNYTDTTTCRGCGVVPVPEGSSETADICPWCFNRVQGLPVPRIG